MQILKEINILLKDKDKRLYNGKPAGPRAMDLICLKDNSKPFESDKELVEGSTNVVCYLTGFLKALELTASRDKLQELEEFRKKIDEDEPNESWLGFKPSYEFDEEEDEEEDEE